MGIKTLLPEQMQAARALLGWSQFDLADKAGLGRATVQRWELGIRTAPDSVKAMQAALQRAGVRFIAPNNGGGPGVRLKKRKRG